MKNYNDMKNAELADELGAFIGGSRDADAIEDFDKLLRVCAGRLRNFDNMKTESRGRWARKPRRAGKWNSRWNTGYKPFGADEVHNEASV